jgi:hypothetical protein
MVTSLPVDTIIDHAAVAIKSVAATIERVNQTLQLTDPSPRLVNGIVKSADGRGTGAGKATLAAS